MIVARGMCSPSYSSTCGNSPCFATERPGIPRFRLVLFEIRLPIYIPARRSDSPGARKVSGRPVGTRKSEPDVPYASSHA
jgi:hypothetical protein